MTETEIRKGLAGVVADTTAVSKVNAETNSLLYRGYPVQELAAKSRMEKVRPCISHLPNSASGTYSPERLYHSCCRRRTTSRTCSACGSAGKRRPRRSGRTP